MHDSSYQLCRAFAFNHLDPNDELDICDVGSFDVNGTYRNIFAQSKWQYTGIDVSPGPNVDVVMPDLNDYIVPETHRARYDVVVSGQVLEHVRRPWKWLPAIVELCKPNGLIWVTAPNTWEYHAYPIDCWRIWPDGLRALFEDARCDVLECFYCDTDTVGLARKSID